MGQSQSTRQNAECTCSCGSWDNRSRSSTNDSLDATRNQLTPTGGPSSSVDRYMSVVTERPPLREPRRRPWILRRRQQSACVCTSYRRVADTTPDTSNVAISTIELQEPISRCNNCNLWLDQRIPVWNMRDSTSPSTALDSVSDVSYHTEPSHISGFNLVRNHAGNFFLVSVAPNANGSRASEDEIATAMRFLESVDPNIGRQEFQLVTSSELRALLLPPPTVATCLHSQPPARVHTQVDYIHCLVPDLQAITACSFYWGKMDRYEAERLLENKPEGTFLLRDSAQEEHLFSVSFRKYNRSLHARIEHYNRKFSFDSHDPSVYSATTVTGLIDHYKDPACVMFFEPMLTCPLPRSFPFSLQQLARAAIVTTTTYDGVDELPLPPRLKAYLKEYHYRQRARVRCLDTLHYEV